MHSAVEEMKGGAGGQSAKMLSVITYTDAWCDYTTHSLSLFHSNLLVAGHFVTTWNFKPPDVEMYNGRFSEKFEPRPTPSLV